MLKQISKIYKVSIDYLLDNDVSIKNNSKLDIFKTSLISLGIIKKNEVIRDKDLEKFLNFIVENKKYIIKDTLQ